MKKNDKNKEEQMKEKQMKEEQNRNMEEKETLKDQKESTKIEIEKEAQAEEAKEKINDGDDIKKKLEEYENEIASLKDSLLRKAAEFENYKRRNENDQMNIIKYAAESFILNILPVYDDLERSLKHIDDENNIKPIKHGLKLVFDKFYKILDDHGVKKIESKGKPFDFNYHEALMQREEEGVPPHTVIEEIEPGYMYKDKVLRHSKVIVSQEPASQSESDEQSESDLQSDEQNSEEKN